MAVPRLTKSEVSSKWGEVTPGRLKWYKAGVEKNTTWEENTKAAKERYKDAVAAPDIGDRYVFGVGDMGLAGWKRETVEKGSPIWGGRVARAKPKHEKKFGPYFDEIASLAGTEPERFPKGDPRNLARVEHFAMGLRKKWEAMRGLSPAS